MIKKVTIVVPVFNEYYYTKMFLESVRNNVPRELYEMIVIDNGSTDETSKELTTTWKDIVDLVITNNQNMGVAFSWNQGIKKFLGENILISNNDVIVFPNAIESMIKVIEETGVWMTCPRHTQGEYGPRVEKEFKKKYKFTYLPVGMKGFFFMLSRKALQEMYKLELKNPELKKFGIGPNPFKLALFNEKRYPMAHYEDVDFHTRMLKLGKAPFEVKEAFIHHFGQKTLQPNLPKLMVQIEENARNFKEQYPKFGFVDDRRKQ